MARLEHLDVLQNMNTTTYAEMLKVFSKKKPSQYLAEMILDISEVAMKQSKERATQVDIKITDILNNSKTEQEMEQRLKELEQSIH